jgi:hypothetical protein
MGAKVQTAEIKASTAWEEVLTTYATHQSVELGRELAEFKLDVDKQKFAVTKEDCWFSYSKCKFNMVLTFFNF